MSQSTFSVRMDISLKKEFDELCADFGMTASTAFNVFARAVVRERKIPFVIGSDKPGPSREDALQTFNKLRQEAAKNGLQTMTLEEINEEISLARTATTKNSK